MSTQLLVLLLLLVMEDEDLGAASLLDDFARDERFALRPANLARLGGNGHHVIEFDVAIVIIIHFFHPDHIARGDLILLTTSADHRVHKSSRTLIGQENSSARRRLAPLKITCACCLSLHPVTRKSRVSGAPELRLLTGNAVRPRTGPPVQANSTILACAVEIGQTKWLGAYEAADAVARLRVASKADFFSSTEALWRG